MTEQRAISTDRRDGIDAPIRLAPIGPRRWRPLAAAAALLLLSGAIARADEEDDDPPHITVRGTASVPVAPDLAVLRLAVGAEDADAAAALKADAAAAAAVSEAAAAQGIAAADVETGTTTLERASPDAAAGGAPRAFRAATTLRLRLRDLARDPGRVGSVLAALAAKGATRVEGVDYRLADPAAALAKATGLAVADARARAEAAASAAHVKLGAVLSIEPPDEPAGGTRLDRVPGGTGQGAVSTTVEVSYEIER